MRLKRSARTKVAHEHSFFNVRPTASNFFHSIFGLDLFSLKAQLKPHGKT